MIRHPPGSFQRWPFLYASIMQIVEANRQRQEPEQGKDQPGWLSGPAGLVMPCSLRLAADGRL